MRQSTSPSTAGRVVVVVGPSGAGKDTLMECAARHFAGDGTIRFVRRVITRDATAGGEAHVGVSLAAFEAMENAGEFAVSWRAHGLGYGIPASVRDLVASGGLAIVNGSRSALTQFQTAFGDILVLNITARPEVLAERLEARGRESREDIMKRLARAPLGVDGDYEVVTVDNSGPLEKAAGAMIVILADALARRRADRRDALPQSS